MQNKTVDIKINMNFKNALLKKLINFLFDSSNLVLFCVRMFLNRFCKVYLQRTCVMTL